MMAQTDADEPEGQEPEAGEQAGPEPGEQPGIWREFNELGRDTLVSEAAMAQIFAKHLMSIRRAIDKQQLPPPVKLMDARVWRLGTILDFIDARLAAEQKAAEKAAAEAERKFLELRA